MLKIPDFSNQIQDVKDDPVALKILVELVYRYGHADGFAFGLEFINDFKRIHLDLLKSLVDKFAEPVDTPNIRVMD